MQVAPGLTRPCGACPPPSRAPSRSGPASSARAGSRPRAGAVAFCRFIRGKYRGRLVCRRRISSTNAASSPSDARSAGLEPRSYPSGSSGRPRAPSRGAAGPWPATPGGVRPPLRVSARWRNPGRRLPRAGRPRYLSGCPARPSRPNTKSPENTPMARGTAAVVRDEEDDCAGGWRCGTARPRRSPRDVSPPRTQRHVVGLAVLPASVGPPVLQSDPPRREVAPHGPALGELPRPREEAAWMCVSATAVSALLRVGGGEVAVASLSGSRGGLLLLRHP